MIVMLGLAVSIAALVDLDWHLFIVGCGVVLIGRLTESNKEDGR